MNPEQELIKANQRIIQLETELAQWQHGAIDKLTPEQLATNVLREQAETLTYHLLKATADLEKKNQILSEKDSDLENAKKTIEYMDLQLQTHKQIIEKLKQLSEMRMHVDIQPIQGQRSSAAGLAPQNEVNQVIDMSHHMQPSKKEPKTIHDFISLVKHVERVKLMDASMIMDTEPRMIYDWCKKLESKAYVEIGGHDLEHMIVFATRKLLKTK